MKVFLFITNIPEDLDAIDEGYLEKEINELNQKAFVIVIFVHPMADDELRTIPYRWSPNYTLHDFEEVLKCVENLFYWDNKTPGITWLIQKS